MPRYVAFLRGVFPTNAKMADLRQCLEAAGYVDVRTVLASGNVAFSTRSSPVETLEGRLATEIERGLGRAFSLTVRSTDYLTQLLASDPFGGFTIPPEAKRIVTFLRNPDGLVSRLPIEQDGVSILKRVGTEVYTTYLPNPKGPVFMTLLERTFGKDITTRTLETVRKCAKA